MKEINLEKLVKQHKVIYCEDAVDMLMDFAKQLLELASENAKIQEVIDDDLDNMEISDYLVSYDDFNSCYTQSVNKQSIINTINQIK